MTMTYIKHVLIVAVMTVLMASCASQSAPQKLDNFVDKTELNASSYSQSDWEKSAIEYQKLVDDYMYSGKEYTDAEKEMAARAMGRYHALLVKNGIESPERKLVMWYKCKEKSALGLTKAQISRSLWLDVKTVRKYLSMSYDEFKSSESHKRMYVRMLDPYESKVYECQSF